MKKLILLMGILLCIGCGRQGFRGNPGAIQVGASIGGMVGSIIGGNVGGYNGSSVGALVGVLAGAAAGNAATTPKEVPGRLIIDGGHGLAEVYETGQAPFHETPGLDVRVKNIRFIDQGRNQAIDAGEQSKIIFDVASLADLPLHGITVYVEEISGAKHLKISSPLQISSLLPGSEIRCTALVSAGKKLKTGTAVFRIQACRKDGACSPVREFSLPLQGKKK